MFPILNPPPSALPIPSFWVIQCTSPKHPVSCIEPGLVTHFIYDIILISIPFSQIIPPSPSPTESKRLFYTYTCLDPKDAFFCIHLILVSQPLFAFEWEDPAGGPKQQLTWTGLPQGFKNSPTIFGEDLASNLESFQPEKFRFLLL